MSRRRWLSLPVLVLAVILGVLAATLAGEDRVAVALTALAYLVVGVTACGHQFGVYVAPPIPSRLPTDDERFHVIDRQLAADLDEVFAGLDRAFRDFDRALDEAIERERAARRPDGGGS